MDFANLDFMLNSDLTNIEIELPDELKTDMNDCFGRIYMTIDKVAKYLYGDEYTADQFSEAGILAFLSLRKEIGNALEGLSS